jgi:hypothetical protein
MEAINLQQKPEQARRNGRSLPGSEGLNHDQDERVRTRFERMGDSETGHPSVLSGRRQVLLGPRLQRESTRRGHLGFDANIAMAPASSSSRFLWQT